MNEWPIRCGERPRAIIFERLKMSGLCSTDPPGGDFREELEHYCGEEEKFWKFNPTPIDDCEFFFSKTCNIANTVKNLIIIMKEAMEHLQKQNTTGTPRTVRDKVCRQLQHITMHIEKLDASMEEFSPLPPPPPTPAETRLESIENDIKEIKAALNLSSIEAEIKDLKAAFHETPKTWANVAENTNTEATPPHGQSTRQTTENPRKTKKGTRTLRSHPHYVKQRNQRKAKHDACTQNYGTMSKYH